MYIRNPPRLLFHQVIVLTAGISILLIIRTAFASDILFEKKLLLLMGDEYQVEIARSTEQRRHGLMFRDRLDKRQGMLFVYPKSGHHRIWMKNTLIPLTVVWFDNNGKVIDIKKLSPCTAAPCPVYGASQPSRYILELSGDNHDLKPGIRIDGLSDI